MNDARSVRIGPLSLFTLIAVICLATLAVLSITTATASYDLARLQADTVTRQYDVERVAQGLVARVDATWAASTGSLAADTTAASASDAPSASDASGAGGALQGLAAALPDIAAECESAADGSVHVDATLADSTLSALIACPDGPELDVELELGEGGTYRITSWNMTAGKNSAPTETLWSGM